MRSVISDQNAVSLTWASTSTTSQSLSFSVVGDALARYSRVSVRVEIFSSSSMRGAVSRIFIISTLGWTGRLRGVARLVLYNHSIGRRPTAQRLSGRRHVQCPLSRAALNRCTDGAILPSARGHPSAHGCSEDAAAGMAAA